MLHPPSLQAIIPQPHLLPNGNTLYCFPNSALELVKLDFTLEAGSCLQTSWSQSHGANALFGEATLQHDAQWMADFMDFRGIVVERFADVSTGNVSFYFLRKYAADLLPLVREMFDHPTIDPQQFSAYVSKRKQKISVGFQRTNFVARNRFYELLYTSQHPLGKYATVADIDKLTFEDVDQFIRDHYRLEDAHIVLAGCIDDELLALADCYLSPARAEGWHSFRSTLQPPELLTNRVSDRVAMPNAVQSSLLLGSVLPYNWDSPEYAQFMVLNTILGGYFGSRLMSNIREDKGYTYGIYSQTHVFRRSICFCISSDVAAEAARPAIDEIYREVERLQREEVSDAELDRVRNVMMGEFIRGIDGCFEVSERYRQSYASDVTEVFTANFVDAVQHVTPSQLRRIAQQSFMPMVEVCAG